MFNKLKIPIPFGNKKQRKELKQIADNEAIAMKELIGVQLKRSVTIRGIISEKASYLQVVGKEFMTEKTQTAQYILKPMSEKERKYLESELERLNNKNSGE